MGSEKMLEMATLGRPFSLGMLYDRRQDILIPGLTLWDCDGLEKDKTENSQPNSEFEIVASESIEDKISALNVEASLKASFLGGLVKVEGSAKYLNDQRTSKNQARVTLKYKTTTKFQALSMNHLGRGNVKHPYVFDQKIATHVVAGILYGAQAFFVFEQEKSDTESHQDIQGNLKVMIEKIPCLSIEGKGSLNLEDKDIEKIRKFSCKFHGDFLLEKTPTTFQDAVEVYQSLPKLLGASGENAVPIKVWLLPLTILDSSAAKLVREISVGLIQEVQGVLEELGELEIRCNDAIRNITTQQFPQISKKLKHFKNMCSEFRLGFQQTLAKKLPSIRGGGEEESELIEVLKMKISSPFNGKNLNQWMDCKDREIYILKSFTRKMKNTKIIPSQSSLHEELFSADHALCFVFTSLERHEPYLSAMFNYLKGRTETDESHTYDVEKEQWYLSRSLTDEIRTKVKLFTDFAEANQENTNIKFLAVGLTDNKHEGSTIYLYKDCFPISENFEPPSKPESVTAVDINHASVTLNISPPLFGAKHITSYSVEYCVSGENEWEQKIESITAEITVSHLKPNSEYLFRCRAVTYAGVGPANLISNPIKTLPCSPPEKCQVEPQSSEILVSWEKPAKLGPDVQILSYIVEYANTTNSSNVEDLLWNQTRSRSENAIISGLDHETEYAVRVRCDCGGAGRSKESKIVKACTTKSKCVLLVDYLKNISKKKSQVSNFPSVYQLPLRHDDVDIDGCTRYTFGKESLRPNRTIMLLGATGSGKSALIDGMINYIVGVDWKDSFRFKLINEYSSRCQAYTQTQDVTVYRIYHQDGFKIPYSLTVIDTPGFGNTRGKSTDQEITKKIQRIFSSADGVTEINAIGFVTEACLTCLTATHKYVFNSVLSIFGKDIAENLIMLVTFSDGRKPQVLQPLMAFDVPCPKDDFGFPIHFKFNNSALFAHNKCQEHNAMDDESAEYEDISISEMFWKMEMKNMKKLFAALETMTSTSLLMNKEVLKH
uniref:Fibronectin type-III domain-containing protein n=1 Tax=Cyprinodon variegatus TaxID=28743 RepID=A0A3Q2E7Z9_CYPVA